MKILGLVICLGTLLGTATTVGIHLYFDVLRLLFVLGGAIGLLVLRKNPERYIEKFGQGAVYFGWLGTLVGLVAFTGDQCPCRRLTPTHNDSTIRRCVGWVVHKMIALLIAKQKVLKATR